MASKDPSIWLIAQAIQDCIQVADGTGDWNYDLSGTGTVTINERLKGRGLSVCIGPLALSPGDNDTTRYNSHAVTYYVFGAVGNSNNYPDRFEGACRLAHDIARTCDTAAIRAALNALEADRGNAIERTRVGELSAGGLPDGNGLGEMALTITINFKKRVTGADGGF